MDTPMGVHSPAALPPGPFHGTLRRVKRVAGLVLSERAYPPRMVLPGHAHLLPYVRLVCRGGLQENDGLRSRQCRTLSVVFRAPREFHKEIIAQKGARSLIIEFGPRFLDRVREFSTVLDQPAEFKNGPVPTVAVRIYEEFLRDDDLSPLAIEGLALELVATAARFGEPWPERRRFSWLEPLKDLLHARFAESLSLSVLGDAVGVHPVHLARSFREVEGCTIGEYVRRLRVAFAQKELLRSDAPLAEIALIAGFADQSHLCRTFRRSTGVTPGQHRASRAR